MGASSAVHPPRGGGRQFGTLAELHKDEAIFEFSRPRDQVAPATAIRSTLIVSSQQALKNQGHWDAYVERLPAAHRDGLVHVVVGTWLPMEEGMVHYQACERLDLPVPALMNLGRDVEERLRRSILLNLAHAARAAGLTPFTVLNQSRKFWDRAFQGSEVAVHRTGPKDARFEIAGVPFAPLTYNRVTFRGVLEALVSPFCQRAFVRDAPESFGPRAMGWRIAWA